MQREALWFKNSESLSLYRVNPYEYIVEDHRILELRQSASNIRIPREKSECLYSGGRPDYGSELVGEDSLNYGNCHVI